MRSWPSWPTSPASFAVEIPGVVRGGLLPTAKEGTLLATRLGSIDGSDVATVAANPAAGRLCTEVPGGGRLRRLGDDAVVTDLPEPGACGVSPPTSWQRWHGSPRLRGRDGDRPGPAVDGDGVRRARRVPRFAPGPCGEDVFASPRIACGTLTVAEDRQEPGGPTVELPVAVLRTASPTPQPDPVVYFEGGPGFGALGNAELFLEREYGDDRDLILFDQRGTGGARPSLNCPEVDEATWQGFATTDPAEVELERSVVAFDACRDRLRAEGIDLDAYDTAASADDVADLRTALGIDELEPLRRLLRHHPRPPDHAGPPGGRAQPWCSTPSTRPR